MTKDTPEYDGLPWFPFSLETIWHLVHIMFFVCFVNLHQLLKCS